MKEPEKNNNIKVILLGESGIGKTCLINITVGFKFSDVLDSTASSSFVTKKYIKDNTEYILNLWDTAGQEKYRAMTKLFIKNTKIVIFVYAIDDKSSFDCLPFWVSTVKEILGNEVILALVGNKSDLYLNETVKNEDAEAYAKTIGAKFKLVSAKTNPKGFIDLLDDLLEEYLQNNGTVKRVESFEIKKDQYKKKKLKLKFC